MPTISKVPNVILLGEEEINRSLFTQKYELRRTIKTQALDQIKSFKEESMLQGHSSFSIIAKSILSDKISVTDIVRHLFISNRKTNHPNQYLEVNSRSPFKANELDQKISNQAVGKLSRYGGIPQKRHYQL